MVFQIRLLIHMQIHFQQHIIRPISIQFFFSLLQNIAAIVLLKYSVKLDTLFSLIRTCRLLFVFLYVK